MRISRWHANFEGRCTQPLAVLSAAALLLDAPPVHGYNRHLSESDVREAYLFGQRHDQSVGRFFDPYETKIPGRSSEPHVRAIGVRTPYSSAVLRSYKGGNTYSAQRAQTDYGAKADVFEVVVWIDIPVAYALSPQDQLTGPTALLKELNVELSQDQRIAPLKATVPPVFERGGDTGTVSGAELHFEYDVRDVTSAPARVQVTGPDGQGVSATFDLGNLR